MSYRGPTAVLPMWSNDDVKLFTQVWWRSEDGVSGADRAPVQPRKRRSPVPQTPALSHKPLPCPTNVAVLSPKPLPYKPLPCPTNRCPIPQTSQSSPTNRCPLPQTAALSHKRRSPVPQTEVLSHKLLLCPTNCSPVAKPLPCSTSRCPVPKPPPCPTSRPR